MSYEGYQQNICHNGHFFLSSTLGVSTDDGDHLCSVCQAEAAWENEVDETNCESWGEIPFKLLQEKFLISKEQMFTCSHCQQTKQVAPAVFRVPTRTETDPLRHWRPEYGGTPLVPIETLLEILSEIP